MNEPTAMDGPATTLEPFDWDAINARGTWQHKDYVTNKLRVWLPILAPLRAKPLNILEIGSFEGRSALFFLSYFKNARLTCIDPFIKGRGAVFDANVAPYRDRLEKIADYSQVAMTEIVRRNVLYNLVYIDGDHRRQTVLMDSIMCWNRLSEGGLAIWDDYLSYGKDKKPADRAKEAIDGFLVAYADEIEILHQGGQVIARKRKTDN